MSLIGEKIIAHAIRGAHNIGVLFVDSKRSLFRQRNVPRSRRWHGERQREAAQLGPGPVGLVQCGAQLRRAKHTLITTLHHHHCQDTSWS